MNTSEAKPVSATTTRLLAFIEEVKADISKANAESIPALRELQLQAILELSAEENGLEPV